jgi:hypothetical protein
MEVGEASACGHERVVGAVLHDVTVFDDHDPISVADRGQAMRDDERGPAFQDATKGLLDEQLGSCIHRGGRLIKDQNRRISQ